MIERWVLLSLVFLTKVLCFDYRQVSSNDYSSLDTLTKSIVKEKQPFVRLEMSKEDLLEMFKVSVINIQCNIFVLHMCHFKLLKQCLRLWTFLTIHLVGNYSVNPLFFNVFLLQYNEFKCRIIREKVKTPTTTVYR